MSILSHFPGEARDVQIYALQELEKNWDKADVFVVKMPVGSGKTRTAVTIQRWVYKKMKLGSQYIVPNNMLLNQIKAEFPELHTTYKKDTYTCLKSPGRTEGSPDDRGVREPPLKCVEHVKYRKHWCTGCPYLKDVKKTAVFPYGVYNYYSYMAYKSYRPVLIADEAHNLIDILRSLMAQKLWKHKVGYPTDISTYAGLHKWAKAEAEYNVKARQVLEILDKPGKPSYVIEKAMEPYGKSKEKLECLKLLPVDTSQAPATLWPSGRVSKIVLLSATIGKSDIQQMGLDNRRICIIDTASPIDAERRPVNVVPVTNASFWNQEKAVPELAEYILGMMSHYSSEKGLIHVPYSLATKLYPLLKEESRLLFHDKDNKKSVFKVFKDSSEPKVLLASGMYEGIDLPYDSARWQIIAKVPWPSLAEPAVKYLADENPEWYTWQTLKTVIQASGRVCRAADDWGHTYVVDSTFDKLMSGMREEDIPKWFRDSLINFTEG